MSWQSPALSYRCGACGTTVTGFVERKACLDARVLDQIIYKWAHSRAVIGEALVEKYEDLAATGWQITRPEIERDVKSLFGVHFVDDGGERRRFSRAGGTGNKHDSIFE